MMKAKKICIALVCVALITCFCACGAKDSYEDLSDVEKLYTVGTWEKMYAPAEKISFNADGTGNQSFRGNSYDFTWKLDEGKLILTIKEFEPLEYSFEIVDKSFAITNIETGTSASFCFDGTQTAELPSKGEALAELTGEWESSDSETYAIAFLADKTGFRYDSADSEKKHVADFNWTYDSDSDILYIEYHVNEPELIYYQFNLREDILSLINMSTASASYFTKVNE